MSALCEDKVRGETGDHEAKPVWTSKHKNERREMSEQGALCADDVREAVVHHDPEAEDIIRRLAKRLTIKKYNLLKMCKETIGKNEKPGIETDKIFIDCLQK